jgi:hypothetical protein
MADFLRDVGLRYAGTLPLYLGINVAVLVLLGWAGYKAHESGSPGGVWLCAFAAVLSLAVVPVSYAQARSYCADLAETSRSARTPLPIPLPGSTPSPISLPESSSSSAFPSSPGILYATSKCQNVWPYGPDAS